MTRPNLLDQTFHDVTERTRELVGEQLSRCCEWEECDYGSTFPDPVCEDDDRGCVFLTSYRRAISEVLVDEEAQTSFLTGCFLQEELNFYAADYPDLSSGWLNFVYAMGKGFVHQRLYQGIDSRSEAEEDNARAVTLVDQVAAKALDVLITGPVVETPDSPWIVDSWAASWRALAEVAKDSAGMALVAAQIGKTLPRQLLGDPNYVGLFDEVVMRGDLGGRTDIEGVIRPDADCVQFGCLVLRAFIAEKIEIEFPGNYEAFMNEKREVVERIHERQQED